MAGARIIALFLLGLIFFSCTSASAEEASLEDTLHHMQKRIEALEKKVSEQEVYIKVQDSNMKAQQEKITSYESKISQLDEVLHRETGRPTEIVPGLDISVGGTMIIQGTDNVNDVTSDSKRKISRTDASCSADVTIAKEFEELDGKAFLHLEAGEGAGLEDNLTLYSNVNRDADNDYNIRMTEFWYEQGLFGDKVALTFGKLDSTAYFDNNEVANDETTQFLSRIFRNSPAIEFPDNTAGIRVAYMPVEYVELGYGLLDGNSNWERIFDSLFNIGQINFKTNCFGLSGNYRFLGWYNNIYHTKWLEAEKTKEASHGFGLSFDQKFTDIITAFCRYGWQDPRLYNPELLATGDFNYSLEHSWSAGFQVEGKPWGREKDALACALGQAITSKDYKKAGEMLDPARRAKSEKHLEVYYRIFVNDHLSISPDFQYIWDPFGKDVVNDTDGIFMGGMRAQVDF